MVSKLPINDEEAIQRKYTGEFFKTQRESIKTPEDYASFIKTIVESYLVNEMMIIESIRDIKTPLYFVCTVQYLLPRLSRIVEVASEKVGHSECKSSGIEIAYDALANFEPNTCSQNKLLNL